MMGLALLLAVGNLSTAVPDPPERTPPADSRLTLLGDEARSQFHNELVAARQQLIAQRDLLMPVPIFSVFAGAAVICAVVSIFAWPMAPILLAGTVSFLGMGAFLALTANHQREGLQARVGELEGRIDRLRSGLPGAVSWRF